MQKIQYAKGRSDVLAKLDGTFRVETTQVAVTELQQSIFNAPPSSNAAPTLKPPGSTAADPIAEGGAKSPQGLKRSRDDESDEGDAPMDEDDDGDAPMEDSSEED
ncbi:MAG: hypothetical protein M1838_001562 [Thelocarpon superellum]|nr:MAG: hypothetical protein M1838_001562 [Thelocarpon superellum]